MLIPILIGFMTISCGKKLTQVSNSLPKNNTEKTSSNASVDKEGDDSGTESTNKIESLEKLSFSNPTEDYVSIDRVVEVEWTSLEIDKILYESKICSTTSCDSCQDQFRSRLNKREIYLNNSAPQYVCVRATLSSQDLTSEWSVSKKLSYHIAPQDILISDLATLDDTSAADMLVGNLSTDSTTDNPLITFEIVKTADTDFDYFSIENRNAIKLSQSLNMLDSSKKNLSLEIKATDSESQSISKTFIFSIGSTNNAPTNIELTSDTILENQEASLIGSFLVTDNAGDTHSFELIGEGNSDLFEIINGQLFSKVRFDFETANSHPISVRVTDSAGFTFEKTLTINIANQNETIDDVRFVVQDPNGSFPDATTILELTVETTNLNNFQFEYTLTPKTSGSKCSNGGGDFELVASPQNNKILLLKSTRTVRLPLFDLSIDVTAENMTSTFKYEYRHDGTKMADNCE